MHRDKPILLLTRPEADSLRFLSALPPDLVGRCHPVIAPVFSVHAKKVSLSDEGDLILSSSNALRTLGRGAGRKAWCVGVATARKAAARGFEASFAGETADELIERFAGVPPTKFIHVRGMHTRGNIADRLVASGHTVEEVIAYDQVEAPWSDDKAKIIKNAPVIVAPVFSPRSARLLAQRTGRSDRLNVIAMSNSVAAEFSFLDSNHIFIASNPDFDAMVSRTSLVLGLVCRVEGGEDAL